MKVTSPAGDFEITVTESSVEGDFIVISGQMGVWDSQIYMKPSDLLSFAGVSIQLSGCFIPRQATVQMGFRQKARLAARSLRGKEFLGDSAHKEIRGFFRCIADCTRNYILDKVKYNM